MPWTEVVSKWKHGALHSGSPSGPIVTDRAKAVAIMLSEKRQAEGGKREYQPRRGRPLRVKHKVPARFKRRT
jgi:hypothetical protein